MELETKQPQYSTADPNSFAFTSMRDRLPIILTQAIDDVHKAVSNVTDADKQKEGKHLIEQLATLKYELQHNRQLTPLPEDGPPDVPGYNAELASLSPLHWLNAPWLFSECYLYRRMASYFLRSTHWKTYDYFSAIKSSTFRSSRAAVLELASKYNSLVAQFSSSEVFSLSGQEREEADRILFTEMAEISLWGNATDLSLLASATYVDIASLQGSEARKKAEKNILINDLSHAFGVLYAAKKSSKEERRVDIVLDNSGFELFVDLVLAAYLIRSGLATVIVFHPKNVPWYVSDVIPTDFSALFSSLLNAEAFFPDLSPAEKGSLAELAQDWTELYSDGSFVLRPNTFWTEGGSFWRLPGNEKLYEDLKESELVVFKGDLNYRKLTADAKWETTLPFEDAIGPLGKKSGIRVLALRTCKADVVVGLDKGKDEELKGDDTSGARKWAWTGKWAVCSFNDGKA